MSNTQKSAGTKPSAPPKPSDDFILVLQDGRIVQRGQHDELVAQPGLYQEIYNVQLKDQEA